ncbi:MAG: D-alanine--D-alanine ligase, partial [Planctomycetota bacterium]
MRTSVAVLLGGTSPEREVSLKSGHAVASALAAKGHRVTECDVRSDDLSALAGGTYDCAFIALHGGFGENGGIQALLEEEGLPYCGSGPEASGLAMDKWLAKGRFVEEGIPTPTGRLVDGRNWRSRVEGFLIEAGLPIVVKPRSQGSSVGVRI